jgi:tetratricopeptide (TPR) repeat protein
MTLSSPGKQIAVGLAVHLSLVVAMAAFHVQAGDYPPWSRERASLLDGWRAKLDAAEELSREEKAEKAETIYRELLEEAAREKNEGLLVARAVDGLADLYRSEGRSEEAAELYRRSTAMLERLLGPRQPRLAVTLHNLGTVCLALGEPREAELYLQRALAIWEESYGAESPQAENSRRALRIAASHLSEQPLPEIRRVPPSREGGGSRYQP